MSVKPTTANGLINSNSELIEATRIFAKISGKSFENALECALGSTESYKIADPVWAKMVPEIARDMKEYELFYMVIEYRYGLYKMSIEIWYSVNDQKSLVHYRRIRLADLSKERKQFGETDFDNVGNDWVLIGGEIVQGLEAL